MKRDTRLLLYLFQIILILSIVPSMFCVEKDTRKKENWKDHKSRHKISSVRHNLRKSPIPEISDRGIAGIINNSGNIVITDNAYLVIANQANYTTAGTGYIDNNGAVILSGSFIDNNEEGNDPFSATGDYSFVGNTTQSLPPGNITNVVINNPNGAALSGDLTVDETLTLSSGDLDLAGNNLILGSTATLVEDAGIVTGSGSITTTRALNDISENIAGLGAEIISTADLGETLITRGHTAHSATGGNSILKYYDIAPATNTGLNATLVFHYNEADLNGQTESNLALWKSEDDGSTWINMGGSVDTEANTITLHNLNSFSLWTAADDDNPLPVTLSSFTAELQNLTPHLQWTTQTENENLGWNVYRSSSIDLAAAILLTEDLLEGAGTISEPTNYSFLDPFEFIGGVTYFYWLESISYTGVSEICSQIALSIPYGINGNSTLNSPILYGLRSNFPNPFNPSTKISFLLEKADEVALDIYDIRGRKIKTLFTGQIEAERVYNFIWNGEDRSGKAVSSGIYYYKMKAGTYSSTKKMILLK